MTTPLTALGATVDYTDANNPKLVIPYDGVKVAGNWGTKPTSAGVQDLDQWMTGIVGTLGVWNAQQTTEIHDVVVALSFVGNSTRNNIANRPTITYNITVYNKTPLIIELDCDDVG